MLLHSLHRLSSQLRRTRTRLSAQLACTVCSLSCRHAERWQSGDVCVGHRRPAARHQLPACRRQKAHGCHPTTGSSPRVHHLTAAARTTTSQYTATSHSPATTVIAGRPRDARYLDSLCQACSAVACCVGCVACLAAQDMGVAVYYTVPGLPPPFSEWQYVGPVSLTHPTAVFRAPWHGKIPVSNNNNNNDNNSNTLSAQHR